MPTPPGSGTLADQLTRLRKQVAELSRATPRTLVCQARLTAELSLSAYSYAWADYEWDATYDPRGMFSPASSSEYAYIAAPVDGYYSVHLHTSTVGPTTGTGGAIVTVNGGSTSDDSIAIAARDYPTGGGDGAVCDAICSLVHLAAGDIVYWLLWSSEDATAPPRVTGVPTEITVRYVAARA